MECYCHTRNVQDLFPVGTTSYERRFEEVFSGPVTHSDPEEEFLQCAEEVGMAYGLCNAYVNREIEMSTSKERFLAKTTPRKTKLVLACTSEAHESTRKRNLETQYKAREDHIAE